jgi:subtilisin family serine protease
MFAATLLVASVALTQPAVDDAADRYIVVFEEDVDHPSQIASGIEQRQDLEVGHVYSSALEGFSAEIPDQDLAAVRANPRVAYIERDRKVYVVAQVTPWGITRIGADVSSTTAGDGQGEIANVNAYIIDTGNTGKKDPNTGEDQPHPDLNVVNHVNFTGDGKNHDCNGHGTHVAGTVAAEDNTGDVVGVSPGAPLTGVKVLGCDGSGWVSDVADGIDWVTANAEKPAIANLSLSTPANKESRALDDAVRRSASSGGIFYSVAAGNYGRNACDYSPARAGLAKTDTNGDGKINRKDSNGIVTTAATDFSNEEASFGKFDSSNYGPCVDLWAPGKRILSTWKGGGTATFSGTSMAAPHVGGTAALYLSQQPIDALPAPSNLEDTLKKDSILTGTTSKNGDSIRLVYAGG